MKVTNISEGPRGLNTKNGPVLVEPGQTIDDIELVDAELKVAKATGWFDFSGKVPSAEEPSEFKAPFLAKDKGGGWWAIYDADDKEVKSLRKDDAEIFNALSDADKAAEVAKK